MELNNQKWLWIADKQWQVEFKDSWKNSKRLMAYRKYLKYFTKMSFYTSTLVKMYGIYITTNHFLIFQLTCFLFMVIAFSYALSFPFIFSQGIIRAGKIIQIQISACTDWVDPIHSLTNYWSHFPSSLADSDRSN